MFAIKTHITYNNCNIVICGAYGSFLILVFDTFKNTFVCVNNRKQNDFKRLTQSGILALENASSVECFA